MPCERRHVLQSHQKQSRAGQGNGTHVAGGGSGSVLPYSCSSTLRIPSSRYSFARLARSSLAALHSAGGRTGVGTQELGGSKQSSRGGLTSVGVATRARPAGWSARHLADGQTSSPAQGPWRAAAACGSTADGGGDQL